MISDVWHRPYWPFVYLGRVSVQLFYPFSTWVSFVFLLLKSKSSLYVQNISVLPDMYFENTLSYVYFFIFLMVSYEDQKMLIMVKLNFSIFFFTFHAFCVPKKSLCQHKFAKIFLYFSFNNLIVLAFTFRSMNHFRILHENDGK